MNPFYILYARSAQAILGFLGLFLHYREPNRLSNHEDVASFFLEHNVHKPMLISGRHTFSSPTAQRLLDTLSKSGIEVEAYLMQAKEPCLSEIERLREEYLKRGCDGLLSIGGGSRIDAAKALGVLLAHPNKSIRELLGPLKVHRDLPIHIAVPTTAGSASEDSISLVLLDEERNAKYAIPSPRILPNAYLHDPDFLMEIPQRQGVESGMDAYCHNLESYLGRILRKKYRALAVDAIVSLDKNLETFYCSRRDKDIAKELLEDSRIGGYSFSRGYVGYVHALAHALGGKTHLGHGYLIAILLPRVLMAYGRKASKKLAYLCDRLELEEGVGKSRFEKAMAYLDHLGALEEKLRIPSYIDVKLSEKDLMEVAKNAYREANPLYPVPKILGKKDLYRILQEAITPWN